MANLNNMKLTKQECIDLCKEIIQYLEDNPTIYAWRGKFLITKHFLSGDYLANRARLDEDIKMYYKLISAKASENVDNAIREGTIQYGYGTYLLKCLRNEAWQTPKDQADLQKTRAEVDKLKSEKTAIDRDIEIGFEE